jgi:hypothetical protein
MENGEEVAMWEDDDALWDNFKDEMLWENEPVEPGYPDDEPVGRVKRADDEEDPF